MNRLAFALSILAIVALAAWAYHVNYRTATTLERVADLRVRIAAEREAIQVLKVEWAYLNAPERLRRLVAQNNGHLQLAPMTPESFGYIATVPYPVDDEQEEMDRLVAQVLSQPFGFSPQQESVAEAPPEASAVQVGLVDGAMPVPLPRPELRWRE